MLFQCTDNQERKLKPAQSLKCTAAETVSAGVFFFPSTTWWISESCVKVETRKDNRIGKYAIKTGQNL